MTPFSVFCVLHLGITATDGYDPLDERGVARRFGVTETELADFLEARGLTCGALQRADFDLSSARLDIEVAPEGISRVELARTLFDELREAVGRDDWEAPAQDES